MRWARFRTGDRVAHGRIDPEGGIEEIDGDFFGGRRPNGRQHRLAEVELLCPVLPRTFYAVGQNYHGHLPQGVTATHKRTDPPERPEIGYRAVNALVGPGEPIVIPKGSSGAVQYEGELVAVIGQTMRHVTRSDALAGVFGYTIGNDVTERSWLKTDRTLWRSKNSDSFKPMGPWIETEVDVARMTTRVRLNGTEVSAFRTGDMIFDLAAYIEATTRYITLHPGDVIWLGTDGISADMKAGDRVEIEIDGIGILANPVIGED